jgi:hypothetical protein
VTNEPAGRWTTEPPTVPGWYWWRDSERGYAERPVWIDCLSKYRGEWWTIPIQEPPR